MFVNQHTEQSILTFSSGLHSPRPLFVFTKKFPHPAFKGKFDIQELLLTEKGFDCAN